MEICVQLYFYEINKEILIVTYSIFNSKQRLDI